MKLLMPQFARAQVLVVGDVMLDRYWHGSTGRISPEAPVPVVKVSKTEDRPGGAGNVALNIGALGAGVTLAGIVGNDEAGDSLASRLLAASVYCDFLKSEAHPTITKLRVISRQQQLLTPPSERAEPGGAVGRSRAVSSGAPGRIRTCAHASGGHRSIP